MKPELLKEKIYNQLCSIEGYEPDQGIEEFNKWLKRQLDIVFEELE